MMTNCWQRLPREVMVSLSIVIIKTQLHTVMSNLLAPADSALSKASLDVSSSLSWKLSSLSLSLTLHAPFLFPVSEFIQKSARTWLSLLLQNLSRTRWMSGHPYFLPKRRSLALRSPESINYLFRKGLTSQAEWQIVVLTASVLASNSFLASHSLFYQMRGLGNWCHRNHQATTKAQEQVMFLFLFSKSGIC